jgi:pyruvate,orthophosphate dikinase
MNKKISEALEDLRPHVGNKCAWLIVSMYELGNHAKFLTPFDIPVHADKDLQEEMCRIALREFGTKLALRTSPTHSMPGILESHFDLQTKEEIFKAIEEVKRVWDSEISVLWRKKFCPEAELAFILQECIEAERYGVLFTHDPVTGESKVSASWSGNRGYAVGGKSTQKMKDLSDTQKDKLRDFANRAIELFEMPLDIEFAFLDDILYILQIRPLKLSTSARLKAVSDFLEKEKISWDDARKMFTVEELTTEKRNARIYDFDTSTPLGTGVAASAGVVTGKANLGKGKGGILFVKELDGKNENELFASIALVSSESSKESHGAIRARERKVPAVVEIGFTIEKDHVRFDNGEKVREGETVTIDGTLGRVYRGKVKKSYDESVSIAVNFLNRMTDVS